MLRFGISAKSASDTPLQRNSNVGIVKTLLLRSLMKGNLKDWSIADDGEAVLGGSRRPLLSGSDEPAIL